MNIVGEHVFNFNFLVLYFAYTLTVLFSQFLYYLNKVWIE